MAATFWWDKVGNEMESANGDPYRAILGVTGQLAAQVKPGAGVRGGYLEKDGATLRMVSSPTETEVELGGTGQQIRRDLRAMLPSRAVVPAHRDILIPAGYCLFMHGKPSELDAALTADIASGLRALVRFQETLEMRWIRYMKVRETDTARTVVGVGGPNSYWRRPLKPERPYERKSDVDYDDRGWMRGGSYGLEGYDQAKGGLFSAVTLETLRYSVASMGG